MRAKEQTKIVNGLLMKYQNCRDSDSDLMIGVLQVAGANLTPKQREVIRGINFESIRRLRQRLQEQGKYPASPEVAAQRKQKAELIKNAVPYGNEELLQKLINKPRPEWLDGIGSRL